MNRYAVRVRGELTAPPGRWLWIVKWLLLVPHYVVLFFLWVAYLALTLAAYVAVLVTGRYPESIFEFNIGVLRWSWRVSYYGYQVLGTDRYPPFTLAEVPDYPAGLDADPPQPMPRWRPLVAWLLAVPHLMLLGALAGASYEAYRRDDLIVSVPAGVATIALLIVGLALLFTGRYPGGLHALLVGISRWAIRVVAYVTLLTREYPPFRLDQGAREPDFGPSGPAGQTVNAPGTVWPVAQHPGTARTPAARTTAMVAGILLMLGGLASAALGVGGLVLTAQRDHGYVTGRPSAVVTTASVLTSEDIEIHADQRALDWAGVGDVRVTATGAGAYFLGVADTADVDRWLSGVAHDELVRLDADGADLRRVDGISAAVGAPAEQTFWLASATGIGTVQLDWRMTDGHYTMVLANADGSPGIASEVRAATRIPDLTLPGAALLAGGLVATAGGIALVLFGASGLGGGGTRSGSPAVTGPPGRKELADITAVRPR